MKLILRLIVLPLLTLVMLTLVPAQAHADAVFDHLDCDGAAKSSAVCAGKNTANDPVSGSDGIIMKIVNLVAIIAGLAAVIVIVLAGLRMVTSGGSSEDVANARRALIYATVGLVVLVIARTIVVFALNKI